MNCTQCRRDVPAAIYVWTGPKMRELWCLECVISYRMPKDAVASVSEWLASLGAE